MDDVAREKYALACLTDGNEGTQANVAALTTLLTLGYPEPEADVRGYYPELFQDAIK